MSYCINPNCPAPQNRGKQLFCQGCGSELLLEGCYRVTRLLSDPNKPSGFGTIYEVEDGGKQKILKLLHNIQPKAIELFQQEAEVLKRLVHPGIPRVESDGYFIYFPRNSQQPLHCLVMEKIEGVNLEEYIIERNHQPISERAAVRWLKQIVEILHQVHQQQYFHRDIKPPNIMLRPDGQLTLIDFGTAREVTQTFMQKVAGQQVTGIISAGYTPLEQVNGKAVPQSDFFALGRTFIYLLTGKSPDNFSEDPRTGELIWRDSATDISKQFADLIDYLMAPFPGNRPRDTQEILQRIAVFDRNTGSKQQSEQNRQSSTKQAHKQPALTHKYAGFWRRSLAYVIDVVILTVSVALLWKAILYFPGSLPDNVINGGGRLGFALFCTAFSTVGGLLGFICLTGLGLSTSTFPMFQGFMISSTAFIIKWLYFTCLESSVLQGTLGKKILGIMVTDLNGVGLSFGHANARFWSKTVSTLIILIGFIMSGFTKDKQALHDKMAGTLILKKR